MDEFLIGSKLELLIIPFYFHRTDVQTNRKTAKSLKQTGSKILVRNIPFQAKIIEVRELFKAFGELKSIRIPKKMTPGEDAHRGFGFVDFNSKSDAKVCI